MAILNAASALNLAGTKKTNQLPVQPLVRPRPPLPTMNADAVAAALMFSVVTVFSVIFHPVGPIFDPLVQRQETEMNAICNV